MHRQSTHQTKLCCAALLGPTNAGKSTLVNQIVGSRVSIVTPKAQTTRNIIRAVCEREETQLVLTDAPGIFAAKKTIDHHMVKQAWASLHDSDVVIVLVDAKKGLDQNLKIVLEHMAGSRLPHTILALNKIDLVNKDLLLPLVDELRQAYNFKEIFMISALKNDGVEALADYLFLQANNSPWIFESGSITDMPSSFIAKEVTRKHLLLLLKNEVPHELSVEQEKWEETERCINLHQVVYVGIERHKKIVIGKNGQLLKQVGVKARREIGYLMDKRVSLFLFVKVCPQWERDFVHANKI